MTASYVDALGEHTEPTVQVMILFDDAAKYDGTDPYYARVIGGSDHAGFSNSRGPDPETARRNGLSRYRRRRLGVEWPSIWEPDYARNPLAGQVAINGCRYALWRRVGLGERVVCWIMLNPGTDGSPAEDETIRRVCEFSRSWGFHWVTIGSLWPYCVDQTADLPQRIADDGEFVGREVADSDRRVRGMAERADLVIVAWGDQGRAQGRDEQMLAMLAASGIRPHALAITQGGAPRHPLRLPASLRPEPLEVLRVLPPVPLHVLDGPGVTYFVIHPPCPRPVFVTNSRRAAARYARTSTTRTPSTPWPASAIVEGVGQGRARSVRYREGRRRWRDRRSGRHLCLRRASRHHHARCSALARFRLGPLALARGRVGRRVRLLTGEPWPV